MSAAKIRGLLLECIIRNLLIDCGFFPVKPDGSYIYQDRGLNFINGRGAAHDADVLMEPPIQIPFSYPSRINYECKAYKTKVGLPVIRNALGLRYDINEFEILTEKQIRERKNNRRSKYSITNRQRYNYQVGVASVNGFTKDAFEFAANNKIPLISLNWFLPVNICNLFDELTESYFSAFTSDTISRITQWLKNSDTLDNPPIFVERENYFNQILEAFIEAKGRTAIGLLESGDIILLNSSDHSVINSLQTDGPLSTTIHFTDEDLHLWRLVINGQHTFQFYLPENILQQWKDQFYDRKAALEIKSCLFARIFVFKRDFNDLPFRILRINNEWLENQKS